MIEKIKQFFKNLFDDCFGCHYKYPCACGCFHGYCMKNHDFKFERGNEDAG